MKKRKDGRYCKKITLPNGQKKFIYGKSAPEVTQKERDILREYESGVILGDETRVLEWAKEWYKTYKSALRYKTKESYLNALNNHITPFIGGLKLKEVKPIHIQQIMNNVADKSETLQSKILITLRQLFETARQNHLLSAEPVKGIKITKNTKSDKIKFLSEKEWRSLLKNIDDEKAKLFCAICLFAGLRRGEALGLQWGDIEKDKLTVNRAISFTKNLPSEDQSLKTKASNREVPIPQDLKGLLDCYPRKNLYLFTDSRGNVMSKMAFRRMWEKVSKSVSFTFTPHMLRHTYATILHNADVDLKTAQVLLGHSDIRMTANIYTHIEKGQSVKAISKIENFITGSHTGSQKDKKII